VSEKIAYISGCCANYYDPRIGEAFVEVMETNRIEVLVAEQRCCACRRCATGTSRGEEELRSGRAIAGPAGHWEPGDRDHPPELQPDVEEGGAVVFDSEEARFVSSRVMNASECLLRLLRGGRLDTKFRGTLLRVPYHNPCHVKVQGIRREPVELLESIPGIAVCKVVDSC
jgi:glycerol-3-phosphate dehydrogenase subunit C